MDEPIKFKAMYDYIACKRIGDTRRSESGVIRGMTSKEKPLMVEVVDVGPTVNKKELVNKVELGDKLLILKYSGVEVELNKNIITFIKTTDIIAKIEG
jgi:co-chaperonin GroES (HSP10)